MLAAKILECSEAFSEPNGSGGYDVEAGRIEAWEEKSE
jgi:hypothetical protein